MIAGSDVAHYVLAVEHFVAVAGNSLAFKFQTHQFLGSTFCLLLSAGITADEAAFLVEFHKHAEGGSDG